MRKWFEKYKVTIPEGEKGDWKIKKFVVSQPDANSFNLSLAFQPGGYARKIDPGKYTKLVRKNHLVMSDTPAEISDNLDIIQEAKGKVLVNGLGLGVVLAAILKKPEVKHVTVIEISQDLVDLVGPFYMKKAKGRLTIIIADAMVWRPKSGEKFDVVWHDIWDDICSDNLPQIHKLHRSYGRRCNWQGSWAKEEAQNLRERNW